jgi:hypothetical protein
MRNVDAKNVAGGFIYDFETGYEIATGELLDVLYIYIYIY